MQNVGGQTKSIMVFSEVAYYLISRSHSWTVTSHWKRGVPIKIKGRMFHCGEKGVFYCVTELRE